LLINIRAFYFGYNFESLERNVILILFPPRTQCCVVSWTGTNVFKEHAAFISKVEPLYSKILSILLPQDKAGAGISYIPDYQGVPILT